jgi:hypothetical protein
VHIGKLKVPQAAQLCPLAVFDRYLYRRADPYEHLHLFRRNVLVKWVVLVVRQVAKWANPGVQTFDGIKRTLSAQRVKTVLDLTGKSELFPVKFASQQAGIRPRQI